MGEKIKDLIKSQKNKISNAVSSNNRLLEDTIIKQNKILQIPMIPQSYRRYGYGLLSYTSKKLVFEWFKDYKQEKRFKSIQAKITNSGMSAIDLTITTLALFLDSRKIIKPKQMYFASDELLNDFKDTMLDDVISFSSKSELERMIKNKKNIKEYSLFIETCSNNLDMTFYEEKEIKKYAKQFKYVIVDGSLIGLSRINPLIFDQNNVIYVESLSKNYHQDESSRISAGLVVYPKKQERFFQRRFYCSGHYLQLNDLMELPINLYQVGKERIQKIAKNAKKFYDEAKNKESGSKFCLPTIASDLKKIPLVLFLKFKGKKELKEFMETTRMPTRGSFGHEDTYILPIGLMWKSAHPGLARIAFGSKTIKNNYEKR